MVQSIQEARALFPVTEEHAYLNSASQGPPPVPAAEAMVRYLEDIHLHGCVNWPRWQAVMESARARFAELIGGDPAGVAIMKNTTQGILTAAEALPLRRGDIILVNDMEFPGNLHPWHFAARRRGARVKTLSSSAGRIDMGRLRAALNRQVKVVAISAVQYENGFHADMEALGDICAGRGIHLVVDGIQACGVVPVDVMRWRVSMLACGGHKWLMSAGGAGFLYVDPVLVPRLAPANTGWLGTVDAMEFHSEFVPAPGARRYEEGTSSVVGVVGMNESLDLILRLGVEHIRDRVFALSDRLVDGLERKGYLVESSQEHRERSGITLFRGGPLSTKMLVERLEAAGVVVSHRGGGIRVAPHLFNSETDIDRLLDALP